MTALIVKTFTESALTLCVTPFAPGLLLKGNHCTRKGILLSTAASEVARKSVVLIAYFYGINASIAQCLSMVACPLTKYAVHQQLDKTRYQFSFLIAFVNHIFAACVVWGLTEILQSVQ